MEGGAEASRQSKGGKARASSLTEERRKEIAVRAARARWDDSIPVASHEGSFSIGDAELSCANLPDGIRVITQATFLRALGRSRSPKAGTGVLSTVDELPFFLQAEVLKPFIDNELAESTKPIFYVSKSGKKGVGYDATLLPRVAEVYLRLRDQALGHGGKIPARYKNSIKAADVLVRGLAQVGIVALVDEATGYQDVRDRQALQSILDKFLVKELAAWAKRFPDEFYREIFRLRGWEWNRLRRPGVVAAWTKDLVYARLAPGVLDELERRNPVTEKGRRKSKHHQWLTEDVGHPALAQHLHAVIGLMRASESWDMFMRMMARAFPKRGTNMELELRQGS